MMGQRWTALRLRKKAEWGIATAVVLGLAMSVVAGVTNDRLYLFGEGSGENGAPGATVGSGVNIPGAGDTIDDVGPSGAFLDLLQFGSPVYVNVNSGPKARPGTTAGDLGIQLDGAATVLDGIPLNRPDELAALVGGTYPLNYEGITARGLQLWVYPDQAGLNSGRFQSIVFDSILSGGPAITADGKWTQVNSQHVDGSDGVAPVPATVDVAAGDSWYHVMHHNYVNETPGAPRVVPGTGGAAGFSSVLYVDGIAVSANNDAINVGETTAGGRIGKLAVGAAELASSNGTDPTYGNFFQGAVDNLEMYVYGDNSAQGGQDWGTFNLFADNAWIADAIATTVPTGVLIGGDANKDGSVSGDGSGAPSSDDVAAFVDNWRREKRFVAAHNEVTAGDWETWEWGDFNHDGIVNWSDWFILRDNHPSGASLDLSALLVPEPAGALFVWILAASAFLASRRRRA